MENVNINVRIVEENRPNIASFGSIYGHRIFKAEKVACNLNFNEQLRVARDNNGLTTNRSTFRYKVVPIDIVALDLDKDIDGTNVIVINKGRVDAAGNSVEVRCPIDNDKFTKEVTVDNITDALNKPGTGSNATFFASGKKLVEALNPSNVNEVSRIDSLMEELRKQKDMILHTIDANVDGVNAYYQQLDGKKTSVSVSVID